MLYVAGGNLVPILVALLIGFVTGLWIWKFARRPSSRPERMLRDEPPMRRPYMERHNPVPPPRLSDDGPDDGEDEGPYAGPRPEPEVLARRAPAPTLASTPAPTSAPTSANVDDLGDNDIASGAAAAVEDVADQFLGIDSHPAAGDAVGRSEAAGDDLQTMKGVGPKLASLLRAEGITRFDQIAALDPADLARLDAHLGAFKGRLVRDRIVEQAAFLAAGDRDGYEREFGRL